MDPLVSVVLPTHNRPAWLEESLSSILAGTFENFEVVVSNNGRSEDTRRLQARIDDPRVRWFEQDARVGMLDNFLAALSSARGKYVAVMHDDDRCSPRLLEVLVPPLERHPEAVLAFPDHFEMDERGEVDPAMTESTTRGTGRADLSEGLHQPFFGVVARAGVATTGCVFRRDALAVSEITPQVRSFYGTWVSYLLAKTGGAAWFTRERLLDIRIRDKRRVGSRDPSDCLDAIYCLRRMRADQNMAAYRDLVDQRLAKQHLWAGGAFLRQGARAEARTHIVAAMQLDPTLRALGGWTASWIVPKRLLRRL